MDIRELFRMLFGKDLNPTDNPDMKMYVGTFEEFKEHLRKELGMEEEYFAVGDTVKLENPFAIGYFFDYDTGEQLATDFQMPDKALLNFFGQCSFKVLKVLNPRVPFNCGHCDETHYHDCIIEETSLNKKYYSQFKFLSRI